MASKTPSPGSPHPDDRTPPQNEPRLSDWLGEEESGPAPGAASHDPDPITEQVLFDDLLPLTNPPAPSEPIPLADPVTPGPTADPEDAVADLPLAGPGSGWVDAATGIEVPPGSSLFEGGLMYSGSDVYREGPPSNRTPTGPVPVPPGSSIFEITPPPAGEAPAEAQTGNSDVLSGPLEEGSDVLRQIAKPDSGTSNIFDARPEGSGRFEDPSQATEPVTEIRPMGESGEWPASDPLRPASDVFGNLSSPETEQRPGSEVFGERPGSEVFGERPGSDVFIPSPEDNPPRPGSEVFGEAPADAGEKWPGSEVFGEDLTEADLHEPGEGHPLVGGDSGVHFEDSGVDLLNPIPDLPDEETPEGGSIFDLEPSGEGSELDVDALPMPDDEEATESIHLPTGEAGPRSDLFRGLDAGTGDHERVSFDLPDRSPDDPEPSAQVSGLIDWTAPVEGAELASAGLSDAEAAAAGIPDLNRLAAETSTPTPVNTPGPSRRPPSTIPDMSMTERRRPDSRPSSEWMFPQPQVRTSKTGWLVGSALGLLVGAGGFAGAYLAGLLPSRTADTGRPVVSAPPPQTQTVAPTPAPAGAPAMLLAAGEPVAALKAYEAAGEVSTPEDRAGRGQARFLARIRELADQGATPRANDPQLKQAAADLEAVVQAAGTLETDEQKRAGALAALNLGLIKEMTGDAKGAQGQYRAAQKAFPTYRQMFDSALKREDIIRRSAPAKAKTARLTPQEAEEMAHLAVLATVLLQAPADGATDDEPGFYFWEALQLNSAQQYMKAADMILVARAAHEKRRLKLAGRGLNPLSDPLEQMFTAACTQIREYWVFKYRFYGHEKLGDEMRQYARSGGDSFHKFLDEVVTLRDKVKNGDGQKVAQVQATLDKTVKELKTATAAALKAAAEKDALAREKETVAKDLAAAKQSLEDQTKQLADARKGLAGARAKQKTADDALAAVVRELKANKLIDEKDDAAAAVAKLPEVVRKASAAATSTDAKKAAEALVKAQKDLEAARSVTDRAEAVAKKAADEAKTLRDRLDAQAKKATDDLKTLRGQMDTAVKKAADTATAGTRKKLDELSSQLAATRDELARHEKEKEVAVRKAEAEKADALKRAEAAFAAKLAAKEEDYRRQLADVRSGVATPLTTPEVAARERASQEYDAGVRLFFANRYAEAEAALQRATRDDAADARYWYYLGLTQALQRKPYEDALKKAADLEAHGQPGQRALNDALEPLPGSYRQWLSRFRP